MNYNWCLTRSALIGWWWWWWQRRPLPVTIESDVNHLNYNWCLTRSALIGWFQSMMSIYLWNHHYQFIISQVKMASSSSASLPSKMKKISTEDQLQNRYRHSASRCYPAGTCFFPTPIYVRNKGCVVNVKNVNDHLCFIYSILACMKYHQITHNNRTLPIKYKALLDMFNYDALRMPMKIADIPQFEQCNPQVSINVIKYIPTLKFKRIKIIEKSIKHPYFEHAYRSIRKSEGDCHMIYLLLVENNEHRYRYMAITKLKRMLTVVNGRTYYNNVCLSCLRIFQSMHTLEEHASICSI